MFAYLVRRAAGLTLLAFAATPASSQSIVSGTVRGDREAPLAGAVVSALGTHISAPTNDSGRYRLVLPGRPDSVTIVARRIGFEPQSRRVAIRDGSRSVHFSLVPTTALSGVVVTGTTASVGREASPAPAADRSKGIAPARPESRLLESRDASASAGTRARSASPSRTEAGRRTGYQAPNAGMLTAAVWDDAKNWPQYMRFLDRAEQQSWNPWGLEIGRPTVRPARGDDRRQRSSRRRALDVGFLVDATGSMGDEMTFLQTELQDIVTRVRAVEPDLDIRLSVVFYRDRGDAFVTRALPFTRNVDSAVSFISGTRADGGGDYPEDMNAGLEAMMRQQWSRDAVPQMLFLLADAPPQRYPGAGYTYHEAIEDAAAAGIAIFPVAASGTDKPTEFLFRAMAVMTGGKYVFLTDDSGVGNHHDEPDITGYTVERLNDLMVREIRSFVAAHGNGSRMTGLR